MRRSTVIIFLGITVGVFGLHNVYQSWLMVHVGGGASGGSQGFSPHGRDSYRAIEVIAGGSHAANWSDVTGQGKFHVANLGPAPGENGWRLSEGRHYQDETPGDRNHYGARRVQNQRGTGRDSLDYGPPAGNRRGFETFDDYRYHQDDDVAVPSYKPVNAKPGCRFHGNGTVYKTVNGTARRVPLWQRQVETCGQLGRDVNGTWRFFLAEILQVRIYASDKARWTIRELKQWIHFVLLAGVEHIFLCDHYMYDNERLDVPLKRYIDLGLVTYFPWSSIRNPMDAQIRCYQHIIDNYKVHTRWQIAIDMDEYPFALADPREGFLTRFIRNMTSRYGQRVTEISMSNYLMLGQGDRKRDIVIDRINRMTPKPANVLVKPIYRPERVRANVHHNHLLYGAHMNADSEILRMLHYWGARGQDWGPDTPHTLSMTKEINDMRSAWSEQLRNSLLVFGEFDAFSNVTGP